MNSSTIIQVKELGFPWETQDPFLFCAYHEDHYPAGNEQLGPKASLDGRNLGSDFYPKDGWRMYHGMKVPGFPAHPHRGFETVTIVQKGLVDHSDSLGAAGRFGNGDVQWMTAGKGVQHSEMFPLLNQDKENPFLLFQIWLNLPKSHKMVEPHFAMLWRENIPTYSYIDEQGGKTEINIMAGAIDEHQAPSPAPNSWAANPENAVAIWTITMEAGATWTLPLAPEFVNRALYYFKGSHIHIGETRIGVEHAIQVKPHEALTLKNGEQESHFLMLQGRPIQEPVAQYGPFVMNNQAEIQAAMLEFQRTQFGGWPWPSHDQVHPADRGRFAKHADGKYEEKEMTI